MPVFGMMWRCVLGYYSTPSQPHHFTVHHCSVAQRLPWHRRSSWVALCCIRLASWYLHSYFSVGLWSKILVFDINNARRCLKMFESRLWSFDCVWLYDCMMLLHCVIECWDCLSCCIMRSQAPFVWNQGDTGWCERRYVREVKEANQLAEMDTAKSHKTKKDEVAIRTKGKSEKTRTLCTESRAPDRSIYTIFENLRSCRTLSLEQVVDPKPDVCCRPSCVWSCFDFYPNDRCGLVTQFCHKNW